MIDEFVELHIDMQLFPVATIVEGNLFRMIQKVGMLGPILTLNLLLDGGQLTKWWRYAFNDNTRDEVPADNQGGSLPSN